VSKDLSYRWRETDKTPRMPPTPASPCTTLYLFALSPSSDCSSRQTRCRQAPRPPCRAAAWFSWTRPTSATRLCSRSCGGGGLTLLVHSPSPSPSPDALPFVNPFCVCIAFTPSQLSSSIVRRKYSSVSQTGKDSVFSLPRGSHWPHPLRGFILLSLHASPLCAALAGPPEHDPLRARSTSPRRSLPALRRPHAHHRAQVGRRSRSILSVRARRVPPHSSLFIATLCMSRAVPLPHRTG